MNDKKLAVLIDINQFSHRHIPDILKQACQFGEPVIIRAYGIWTAHNFEVWHKAAQVYNMQMMDNSISTAKDTTVQTLIIDALELYYTHDIDGFVLCIHHEKYIPLLEFFEQKQIDCQLFCNQETVQTFSDIVSDIQAVELLADKKPALSYQELCQAIEQTADGLGWANIDRVSKFFAHSHTDHSQKAILLAYQSNADFAVHKATNRHIWIKKLDKHNPKKAVLSDIAAIMHILQCVYLLQDAGELLWLENIATLLHYYQQVLPQHYACESYLDLLLELPFLTKQISDGKILFQYKRPVDYQRDFTKLFFLGQSILPLEQVDVHQLPKISGLRTLDGIYGRWLEQFVQDFVIPSTQRASYDILYRILADYPDIDSVDFGHERWLGVFEQGEQFTVIQENQYWIMLKN